VPRAKRWFPVTQDFNDDPQLWELTDLFGDRALRVWFEICAILDKTENRFEVTDGAVKSIARKCRQSSAKVWRILRHASAKHWLMIPEVISNSPRTILGAPNYWKYHRTAEPERFLICSLLPSETSFLPKKSPAENAGPVDKPVDKIRTLHKQTEADQLVNLAVEIGGRDQELTQKLCQWTISMVRCQKGEPAERVTAVTRACLETVRAKVAVGYEIKSVWALLETIFAKERTKYMQGPENEQYKRAPIAAPVRDLMRGIGNG